MRRGRIITGCTVLIALVCLVASAGAFAATPQDICNDLKDGRVDGTYTAAEWTAFFNDPTIQGYGCGGAITPPPVTPAPATPSITPPGTPPPAGPPSTPSTPSGPSTPPVPLTPTPAPTPAAGVAAVKGARHTVVTPKAPTRGVEGANHTVRTPVTRSAAPLATMKTRGTLPFTGAQLSLFLLVGLALLATGLLLRSTGRARQKL